MDGFHVAEKCSWKNRELEIEVGKYELKRLLKTAMYIFQLRSVFFNFGFPNIKLFEFVIFRTTLTNFTFSLWTTATSFLIYVYWMALELNSTFWPIKRKQYIFELFGLKKVPTSKISKVHHVQKSSKSKHRVSKIRKIVSKNLFLVRMEFWLFHNLYYRWFKM